MINIPIYHYDAFTNIPNKGNPAGVVLNSDCLNDAQMQDIARNIGFNETAFVIKSNNATLRIRYFTPGHEINLCGHATIASLYCMKTRGLLNEIEALTIETNAGILPVRFFEKDKNIIVSMKQAPPQFKEFNGLIDDLAYSLGIKADDIESSNPVLYGSTGTWTLLVPIKKLETFSRMLPNNKLFPCILKEMPHSSVHPFCLETHKQHRQMHARHFSSPYSGTIEDPITGTASGVMGAYYATYVNPNITEENIVVEQGQEINKDGEVHIYIKKQVNSIDIEMSGTAVYVNDINL